MYFPKPRFLSYQKDIFFLKQYCLFPYYVKQKTTSFSHTWCHDISWYVPLDESNPFIDTPLALEDKKSHKNHRLAEIWNMVVCFSLEKSWFWIAKIVQIQAKLSKKNEQKHETSIKNRVV